MTPLVRDAAPGDLPAVRALVAAAGLPLDGHDDAAVVLVAEAGGAVVGTVALERHGEPPVLLLRSAAVDAAHRGTGVGTALTRTALQRAAGAPIALLTTTADGYYPRFGFRAVDRTSLPPALGASAELRGACPATAVAMLRDATA